MTETNRPPWRTSTYSNGSSNCVEAAHVPSAVAVRDTKDRSGPELAIRPADWRAFLARVQRDR